MSLLIIEWTTSNFQNEERIECTFVINVSKKISSDEYEANYKFKVQDQFMEHLLKHLYLTI